MGGFLVTVDPRGRSVSIPHYLIPNKQSLAELGRPWKLLSLALGMAWLIFGALNYGIADWDVGISLLIGGLTYLCGPWSVRVILLSLRHRPRYWVLWIMAALVVALFVVDWVYVLYHTLVGNQMFRLENFYVSSAVYFLAGSVWLYRGSLREFVANLRALVRGPV